MGNFERLLSFSETKPEISLSVLLILIIPLILIPLTLIRRFSTRVERRRLLNDFLENPSIQERLKDPKFNVNDFYDELIKSISTATPPRLGIMAKINQDITWDVSGLIGLIVTLVLMIMVVTRTFADMPREILAGWATILGFYFGKAVNQPGTTAPSSPSPPSAATRPAATPR